MSSALQGAAKDGSQPSSQVGLRIGKALCPIFDVQQLLPEVFRGVMVLCMYSVPLNTPPDQPGSRPASPPIKRLEIRRFHAVLHCPPPRVLHSPRQTRRASRAPNSDIRGCENCVPVAPKWLAFRELQVQWIRRACPQPTAHSPQPSNLRHHLRHHLQHRSALDHQTRPTLRIDESPSLRAPRAAPALCRFNAAGEDSDEARRWSDAEDSVDQLTSSSLAARPPSPSPALSSPLPTASLHFDPHSPARSWPGARWTGSRPSAWPPSCSRLCTSTPPRWCRRASRPCATSASASSLPTPMTRPCSLRPPSWRLPGRRRATMSRSSV